MNKKDYRDSGTGKFTSKRDAAARPNETQSETRTRKPKMVKTAPDFNERLALAVEGLLVTSESDYPLAISSNVRFIALDEFIERQSASQPDSAARFSKLKDLLEISLTGLFVLIVGDEPQKHLLIIGTNSRGEQVCLSSYVVET